MDQTLVKDPLLPGSSGATSTVFLFAQLQAFGIVGTLTGRTFFSVLHTRFANVSKKNKRNRVVVQVQILDLGVKSQKKKSQKKSSGICGCATNLFRSFLKSSLGSTEIFFCLSHLYFFYTDHHEYVCSARRWSHAIVVADEPPEHTLIFFTRYDFTSERE